jgi:ElaB/YqjD/DUF883 family membrane-anchored ribosome-binding protein
MLRQLKDEALQGLQKQVQSAQQQLEALARRLEEAARSAGDLTVGAARNVEKALAVRVRRVEARVLFLESKAKATLAVGLTATRAFDRAELLLEEASELIWMARDTLGDDHAYDALMEKMKADLRDATAAVRSHAENIRQKIEEALSDADRLVSALESDEAKAAAA